MLNQSTKLDVLVHVFHVEKEMFTKSIEETTVNLKMVHRKQKQSKLGKVEMSLKGKRKHWQKVEHKISIANKNVFAKTGLARCLSYDSL